MSESPSGPRRSGRATETPETTAPLDGIRPGRRQNGRGKMGWHAGVLIAGIFVVSYGTNVSTPFLVVYRDRLALSQSATMAIFVVYVVGILATLLIAGPMSDRWGRRRLVLPMTALSGLASLVMIAGRDELWWLLVGRFLLGVVSGGVLGVGAAWLLELLGPGRERQAALTITIVTFAGFGFGPPVSALMHWLAPHPLVLPFVVHSLVTAIVVALMLKIPETQPAQRGIPIRISFGVPKRARREFLTVVVPAAIWVFAFPSTAFALFPVLVSDSVDGGQVAIAAAAGALTAWSGFAARPVVNATGLRAALPVAMILGTFGYAAGALSFRADFWPLVLIAAPLLGAASGTLTVGCLSVVGAMDSEGRRGALTSSFYLLAYPGMAMPLLVTTAAKWSSIDGALIAVTGVAAAFSIGVWMVSRSEPGQQ